MLREPLSPEQLQGMLRLRQGELAQQIADEQARLAPIAARLRQIEQEGTMSDDDVVLKEVEPQLVGGIRAVIPNYEAIGGLFDELATRLPERVHGSSPSPRSSFFRAQL